MRSDETLPTGQGIAQRHSVVLRIDAHEGENRRLKIQVLKWRGQDLGYAGTRKAGNGERQSHLRWRLPPTRLLHANPAASDPKATSASELGSGTGKKLIESSQTNVKPLSP